MSSWRRWNGGAAPGWASILAVACTAAVAATQDSLDLDAYQTVVPPFLAAGPMWGHVGPDSVQVWLRHRKGARIGARGSTRVGTEYRAVPARIEHLGNRMKRLVFEGLPPSTELTVQIFEGFYPTRGAALTMRTAPRPAAAGRVRLAFGANLHAAAFPKCRTLLGAAAAKPDLFLFAGGATCYVGKPAAAGRGKSEDPDPFRSQDGEGDWSSADRMRDRQLDTRNNKWLQPLLRTVPCYAVLGRYDFGPARNPRFAGRRASLDVFRQLWANPEWGLPAAPGCFGSFRRGPVAVFLLDAFSQSAPALPAAGSRAAQPAQVLGPRQLEWLKAGLEASKAPVKILVMGMPFFLANTGVPSFRETAPEEWAGLRDWLRARRCGPLLLLTGGGERGMLTAPPGATRDPWVEFHAPPLSFGRGAKKDRLERSERGPGVLWQSVRDSFGWVDVTVGADGAGAVVLELRDRKNRVVEVGDTRCQTRWKLPGTPR